MIAFHIGLTKCASSTIQKFFASNRDALLALSVDYPTIGLSNNTHRVFFHELTGSDEFDPSLGSLAELKRYWRSAPAGKMVLSAEIFERLDDEEKIAEMQSHLASARPNEPIIIVLITRPLGERMASIYSQNVKFGFQAYDFDTFFQKRMGKRTSYFDIAAKWANSFGWENLRVRPLAASELVNGDIIDDFLSVIGVDPADEGVRAIKREGPRNVSPGWRVIESVRALQDESHGLASNHPILKLARSNGGRRTLGNLAMTVGEDMGWNADKGRYLTRDQAQQSHTVYRDAVRALNEKLTTRLPVPPDLDATGFVERAFLPSARHIPRAELNDFYDRLAERWRGRGAARAQGREEPQPAAKADRPGRASAEPDRVKNQRFEILEPAYPIRAIPHHVGHSAWTKDGGLYAIRYPDTLMFAADGKPESLADFGALPEASDYRCLFIDAAGNLLASRTRKRATKGKSDLVRSTDGGRSFATVLKARIWSMDQAPDGALYAGVYEGANSECGCKVFKSIDGGENWLDISPPEWAEQHHVHGLGVNPETGWLYANLGDQDGFDGCWRNRTNAVSAAADVPAGGVTVTLQAKHEFAVGEPVLVHDRTDLLRTRVVAVSEKTVTLSDPLPFALTVAKGAVVVSAAWTHKFRNDDASLQFIDIVFKDGRIYLSDDTPFANNPDRVLVWAASDDGTDMPVRPEPALKAPPKKAREFGAFFLRKAPDGRLWTGMRPRLSASFIWTSMDGKTWTPVVKCLKEGHERWLDTHSLRDATRTAIADGRTLSGPGGALLAVLGEGALYLSPPAE